MNLYVALMTVSICVVSVMMQENYYGKYRALVLVKKRLSDTTEFHRPTAVTKNTNIDGDKNPYKYEVRWNISSVLSKVYFFCPRDGNTKVLLGNKNSNACECEFPIRTEFTYGGLKHFGGIDGTLIFNGYSYTNPKDEKSSRRLSNITAKDSVYGFVYNRLVKRILYVQYTIYSRDLLHSDEIFAEEKDFVTEPTNLVEEDDFEDLKKTLQYIKEGMKDFPLEGKDQISNSSQNYYRATLASRFHFPFVQYKRPLFHYSNITLVHKDILKLFVETQIFISEIKMNELRIFAVPYFYSQTNYTQDVGIRDEDMGNIQNEGNEKFRYEYAPDIIGYLIFDKEIKQGIAIILRSESESVENKVIPHCIIVECKSYLEHLKKKQIDENILRYAHCCKINRILSKWKFCQPFSGACTFYPELDDLNI